MKVKCINQGNFRNITLNDEYDVITDNENTYEIISDNFIPRIYSKKYFEVIAEPIPDIIEDVEEVGVAEDEIYIAFDYDIENIKIRVNDNSSDLIFYEVASNCGLRSCDGVNFLFENCDQNIDLFRKVITEVLDLIIEENCCCMTLFSTNHKYKEIWTVLDEIMDTKSEVVENPNSELNVKLWIKYTN